MHYSPKYISYSNIIPYHTAVHALDVTQSINFFIKTCRFIELANLTYLELASLYIAASIHDFEHP